MLIKASCLLLYKSHGFYKNARNPQHDMVPCGIKIISGQCLKTDSYISYSQIGFRASQADSYSMSTRTLSLKMFEKHTQESHVASFRGPISVSNIRDRASLLTNLGNASNCSGISTSNRTPSISDILQPKQPSQADTYSMSMRLLYLKTLE
ncbi:hypothetical protein M5689_000086 [Euphorbia peplus]|nr:hypothetical protein M5689_000086 [Euphorbia peplus]